MSDTPVAIGEKRKRIDEPNTRPAHHPATISALMNPQQSIPVPMHGASAFEPRKTEPAPLGNTVEHIVSQAVHVQEAAPVATLKPPF